jgi:hypothetical protein
MDMDASWTIEINRRALELLLDAAVDSVTRMPDGEQRDELNREINELDERLMPLR